MQFMERNWKVHRVEIISNLLKLKLVKLCIKHKKPTFTGLKSYDNFENFSLENETVMFEKQIFKRSVYWIFPNYLCMKPFEV